MATLFPFTQSQTTNFTFQPVLDGNVYQASVNWNVAGQRNYLMLSALDGTPVVTLPVIESPVALPLASITWVNGRVSAVTQQPHGYKIGLTVAITIENCQPDGYNGAVLAYVRDPSTLVYPLVQNPGAATLVGVADWFVNLVKGYFVTSVLVFRNGQFEVSP